MIKCMADLFSFVVGHSRQQIKTNTLGDPGVFFLLGKKFENITKTVDIYDTRWYYILVRRYMDMTKAKAEKHLRYAKEDLEFWRGAYVDACRDNNRIMDVQGLYLAGNYRTLREAKKAEAIAEINEAKRRIAKAQRIAL